MWGILADGRPWISLAIALIAAVGFALVAHYVLVLALVVLARRIASGLDRLLVRHLKQPLRWVLVLMSMYLAIEPLDLPTGADDFTRHVFSVLLISLIAWLLIRVVYMLSAAILLHFQAGTTDDVRVRTVSTQISVLQHVATAAIVIIALAAVLMTFDRIRQLGTAMLASAGIAGIVLGFAAQKTLGNLIAGLQIAFTQPLRMGDAVLVESEFGNIEEITLTYVVVRLWDNRRLIVPITYFVEHPFQNWTRLTTELLGTVLLYVDYTAPVEAIRAELSRILEKTELWDHKVGLLQVTNASERTLELRALVSAADAGKVWDLRCHVRERLVEFIRRLHPDALPRLRTQFEEYENRPENDA
ncbi:MAG: mechanosensitive ion channel family protein [Solirubrobacterales bacterium]